MDPASSPRTVSPVFRCVRASCPTQVDAHGAHCSDLCARITAALKACASPTGPVTYGGSANVHQARGLGWLDVRARDAA